MSQDLATVLNVSIARRRFLIFSSLGAAALGLSACAGGMGPIALPPKSAEQRAGSGAAKGDAADLVFRLTARLSETQIQSGEPTQTLTYEGEVLIGDPAAVTALPDSYLGPIVRVRRGQRVRVHVRNELDEPTNVHWHGLIVPAEADGHPGNMIEPGAEAVLEFEVRNRPGTYWFHPHPHERTAEQAYRGLAGLFIVTDDTEAALSLPSGKQDIPLIIQDRRLDLDNQLIYIASGTAGMTDQMMGLLGDQILVNGRVNAVLPVSTQSYRLRLLNGSNARIYKLAWSNGAPLTVVGSDGGLLAQPMTFPYVMLSPGERVELWADFSQESLGSQLTLVSLTYEGVEATMMGEAMLPNGAPFDIVTFSVTETAANSATLPAKLLPEETLSLAAANNAALPRSFVFAMDDNMNWTINGRRFELDVVAGDEKVRFGDTEVWELVNLMDAPAASAGGMAGMDHGAHMQQSGAMGGMKDFMAHPVHLHGVHFQVLDRQVDDAQRTGWETVRDGLVDAGWKDTVLVMPGERVRILLRFDGYRGVYLFHCHNLEHEDNGMMRNFEIV